MEVTAREEVQDINLIKVGELIGSLLTFKCLSMTKLKIKSKMLLSKLMYKMTRSKIQKILMKICQLYCIICKKVWKSNEET